MNGTHSFKTFLMIPKMCRLVPSHRTMRSRAYASSSYSRINCHLILLVSWPYQLYDKQKAVNRTQIGTSVGYRVKFWVLSESSMWIEPMSFRKLGGCSNHCATGRIVVSIGHFSGLMCDTSFKLPGPVTLNFPYAIKRNMVNGKRCLC